MSSPSTFKAIFTLGTFPHLESNLLARLKAWDVESLGSAFRLPGGSIVRERRRRIEHNARREDFDGMVDAEREEIGLAEGDVAFRVSFKTDFHGEVK